MENTDSIREQRKKDLLDAVNLRKPANIPIVANMLTFPIAYAKEKTAELIADPDRFAEKWTDIFKDVYYDASLISGMSTAIEVIALLGSSFYFVSSDGVTVQHKENSSMREDEYDELIKNPVDFMLNTLAPRKFKKLNGTEEEVYEALKKALIAYKKFVDTNQQLRRASADLWSDAVSEK